MTHKRYTMFGGRWSRRTGLKPSGPGVFLDWKWDIESRIVSAETRLVKCSIMIEVRKGV